MNTEPIGFLGTTKDWVVTPTKTSYLIDDGIGNVICSIPRIGAIEENKANSDLLCASKKMAVALQNDHDCMLPLHCALLDPTMDRESARQILRDHMEKQLAVLKEAGLNP